MRTALVVAALLAGCAGSATQDAAPVRSLSRLDQCRADVAQLQGQLAAEQKLARAARAREETLRRQLEAMKSIERGILEREDRLRSEMR